MIRKVTAGLLVLLVSKAALVFGQGADFLGRIPPPFTAKEFLNTKGGKPPDTAGKVVMYEFWTTWCGVCVRAIPHLIHLDQTFRKKGLVLLSITYEERPAVERFLKKSKITYPVALDQGMEMCTAYGVRGVPTAYILDVTGRVIWNGQPESLTDDQIEELLRQGFRANDLQGGASGLKEMPALAFDKNGQGPPVVLIHELGGSAKDWDKVARVWGENLTVYTPDLYGHGRTPPLEVDKRVTITDMARGVLHFISKEKIERPILVGHGLGGLIALQLAQHRPTAYTAVIILDATPAPKAAQPKSVIAADLEALAASPEKFIRAQWSGMATRPADVEYIVKSALATDRSTFRDLFADRCSVDLRPGLGSVQAPLLLISAEPPGGFSPMNDPEKLYDGVPKMSLSTMSGTRHYIMLDAPQNFTSRSFTFLAQVFKRAEEADAPQRSPLGRE